ncbi:MAG: choice-of-anchor tandem repeat GloVer-containing protein [Bryobacteraceae bacterium]|jgi:uncharacterized repeat protein (TIGR03803 family)
MKRITGMLAKLGKRALVVLMLSATMAIGLGAQTFTTLFYFHGAEGSEPEASLIQAADGNLYGTTVQGGTGAYFVYGTVFKVASNAPTTLYTFGEGPGGLGFLNGSEPFAGVVQGTDGNFYGTTYLGGTQCATIGCGTVFKVAPSGSLTTLHSFDGTDGWQPIGGVIEAADGNFYGTTTKGGAYNGGTVFKITPGGALTTLYNFCSQSNCADGDAPQAALVQAANGDLYGTTTYGGTQDNCYMTIGEPSTCGTVFRLTLSGTLTTLHSFDHTDGYFPSSALVQATNGYLYGTTSWGGPNCGTNGCGTVFQITPRGTLTTLHSFDGSDGETPYAGLIQATDGNLYGTTLFGGDSLCPGGCGTVFKITLSGTLTTLHNFCFEGECADGVMPYGGLVQATNGEFYGTTTQRSYESTGGTVFSLAVGLGPFVRMQTAAGKVGASVSILGTDLTGATRVSFHGAAAAFTVVSPSLITTTVPAGATTGKVEVSTPGATLLSNVPFRVTP